jgi:hypothetical protein
MIGRGRSESLHRAHYVARADQFILTGEMVWQDGRGPSDGTVSTLETECEKVLSVSARTVTRRTAPGR